MDRRGPEPWHPDRTWADPFIGTLALLIILLVGHAFRARHTTPRPPSGHVEIQGRLADVALAATRMLGSMAGRPAGDPMQGLVAKDLKGWDRAILAVYAAEKGDQALAADLARDAPGPAGDPLRRTLAWAYQGEGRAPEAGELEQVRRALGEGYAASILEARSVKRSGGDPKPFEARAEAWVMPRLASLAVAGVGALLLALGGLAFMAFLAVVKADPAPAPHFGMSGRAVLIVLLGWFLVHLLAGDVVKVVLAAAPFLRAVALPLSYTFHALLGTAFLCLAEGIDLRTLAARLAPGRAGRALATGLGFLAMAFTLVVAVGIAISPFLRGAEPPQRELMEMLSGIRGPVAVALLFLTVAVIAPVFEELLFRGFLLPWLGERLQPRLGARGGWALAVVLSGLLFGAMHMQPLGMPTLGTLGIVLGFAFLRTGNLLTSILVHGIWNGGIFILMRMVG